MELCPIYREGAVLFYFAFFLLFFVVVVKTHKQEFRLARGRGADFKLYKITGWGGLAQLAECLPSLHEALGSIPSTA